MPPPPELSYLPTVEAKDASWIPAEPVPGAFVVNIGDIVDTLTSHQYKSTFHRVIHRGDKYRVSIPFFFEPSIDSVIKPLKGLVPEGQEGDVKPFKVRPVGSLCWRVETNHLTLFTSTVL
jgi:isopenicillin N synthase-like dioxygenase